MTPRWCQVQSHTVPFGSRDAPFAPLPKTWEDAARDASSATRTISRTEPRRSPRPLTTRTPRRIKLEVIAEPALEQLERPPRIREQPFTLDRPPPAHNGTKLL